ncbi:hypothetical protein [Caldimonas brevitalea]|uniref:Uncharacterized protein n=1 Tax=Caldimonas brevitalea TaxID=413882 RepID=A0A0G3BGG6_9BURK|nr:hypothetical protein [Caldimonas brevitalea]AKJ28524.1 hypothetical protein AAW51_1833 [Caldimonas brevitalea]
MTRSIYIYCDGGFGNRYNALISGLILAEAADLSPVIVWPTNNWCGAAYEEIFAEMAHPVVRRELRTFVDEKERYHHLMVEDHLGMNVPNASPTQLPSQSALLDYVKSSPKDVFYYTALIPSYMEFAAVRRQVLALRFRPEIMARAEHFVQTQTPGEFFGVQIRKTDFGAHGADDNNLYDLIAKCPDRRFFVCSDDKTVEERFRVLPNVAIHDKSAHVEKLVDGGWTQQTADQSGRVYACNINRSALSVIDAIVDLLILSRSKVVKTSSSTFLNAALMIQACTADAATR